MNYKKLIYSIKILSSFILIGCASTTQVTELSSEVQNLNKKVDQISSTIDVLKPDIEQAKNESNRANKRLDNQISFYRK